MLPNECNCAILVCNGGEEDGMDKQFKWAQSHKPSVGSRKEGCKSPLIATHFCVAAYVSEAGGFDTTWGGEEVG